MHELGVVFHIANSVEKIAVENGVNRAARVVVQIGEVSTIIPEYLIDCWKWKCTKSEILAGCELEIETIPAVTYCEDCAKTYGTVEHGKTCPYCGSENTYLVQGNEHTIKEVEVYNDDDADANPELSPEAQGMYIGDDENLQE